MSIPAELDGSDAGPLGRLALSRSAVDRATQRRADAEWIEAAWADPRTRVSSCTPRRRSPDHRRPA